MNFLNSKNLIFNKQFGFRSRHSTTPTLISLTEKIRNSLDKGNFSCGGFIDLQKAFDTVDHSVQLGKLEHYDIRGIANGWFNSYLTDRHQAFFLSGKLSKYLEITCGVPQGSVLGLCYSSYKLMIFLMLSVIVLHTFLLKSIKKRVNIDLKLLLNWLNSNKIALNVAKTEVTLFRYPRKAIDDNVRLKLNEKRLTFTPYVKYLGILS